MKSFLNSRHADVSPGQSGEGGGGGGERCVQCFVNTVNKY